MFGLGLVYCKSKYIWNLATNEFKKTCIITDQKIIL